MLFIPISDFEIAPHTVTVAEYALFKGPPLLYTHDDEPITGVSWFDAMAYCEWVGARLPTEQEWELAARGGLEGKAYPWGDELPADCMRAMSGPDRVGRRPPNGYGLYDMCENVHEWCADWFTVDKRRASRGGSWRHHVKASRCDARSSLPPELRYADYGFRLARHLSSAIHTSASLSC